jgi:hypothetical protein
MMLQACLGLHIDARLPIGIDRLEVAGLRVGAETVDLLFERDGRRVVVHAGGPARGRVRTRR